MADIRPIETAYNGYRFRSRLEARWAIFLDSLGAHWEYEPQGFHLDGHPYLPDFWVPFHHRHEYPGGIPPVCGFYLEIKPTALTEREELLCLKLAQATGHTVYAAAGNVGEREFVAYKWHPTSGRVAWLRDEVWPVDNVLMYYLVAECVPQARQHRWDILPAAFRAARSARFEHGEKPRGKKATRRKKGKVSKAPPPPPPRIETPDEIDGPFHVGSLVEHKEYGVGKVTGMSKRAVGFYFEVRFNTCGSRKFIWPKTADSLWVLGKGTLDPQPENHGS